MNATYRIDFVVQVVEQDDDKVVIKAPGWHYVATKHLHGWPLEAFPVTEGTLCDGIKVAEGRYVATAAKKYDAVLIANLHAKAHAVQEVLA